MIKELNRGWPIRLGVVLVAFWLLTTATVWAEGAAVVRITTPVHDSAHVIGAAIQFSGSYRQGRGAEQETVSMTWESSMDGKIGTGMEIRTSSLSVGNHRITLTANGASGPLGSDTIRIRVDYAKDSVDLTGVGGVQVEKGTDYIISPF